MQLPAVILLSGGLDSTTAAAIARHQGFALWTLSVDYGQRHRVELEAADRIAEQLGAASHRIVRLDPRAFAGSALTGRTGEDGASGGVPKDRPVEAIQAGIPATYVPARNLVFLSLAVGLAEVLGAGEVFIGVSAVDYSGYPDCRPEFIDAFQHAATLATRIGIEGGGVRVRAPLIDLSKAETIRRGTELGVDYALTGSCYDPDERGRACGRCDACGLRRRGFEEASIPDPTRYAVCAMGEPHDHPLPIRGPGPRADRAAHDSRDWPGALPVSESFVSLQGEGALTGVPSWFVRLGGCNLRCVWCDTPYASWTPEYQNRAIDELIDEARASGTGFAVVTGGEPMIFPRVDSLCARLRELGASLEGNAKPAPASAVAQMRRDDAQSLAGGAMQRFWRFDLSAQPGRSYRYRMEIALPNPLFGFESTLDEASRAQAESTTLRSVSSAWSEPITVPERRRPLLAATSRVKSSSTASTPAAASTLSKTSAMIC